MKTPFERIVDISKIGIPSKLNLDELFELASQEKIYSVREADKDLLLGIDLQFCFMEGGVLGVPGSRGDVERTLRFIYPRMYNLTIMSSKDTHPINAIFHPTWWVNPKGDHPEPFTTIITYEDVLNGKWIAANPENQEASLHYLKKLEMSKGKKKLCIWPVHAVPDTVGWMFESQYARMINFHSIVTMSNDAVIVKGTDPFTEMYGILAPEVNEDGTFNQKVIEAIINHRRVFVCGEAASHCVLESIIQIVEYFKDRPDIIAKIIVLTDCMSPIVGYEEETVRAFNKLKKMGVKFMTTAELAA